MSAAIPLVHQSRDGAIRDAVSAHCVRLGLKAHQREACVRTAIRLFVRGGSSAAWAISAGKSDADAISRSQLNTSTSNVVDMPSLDERVLKCLDGQNAMTMEDILARMRITGSRADDLDRAYEVGRAVASLTIRRMLTRHVIEGEPTMYSRPAGARSQWQDADSVDEVP